MRDPSVQCFGINALFILHVSPPLLPMHVSCHVPFYMCLFSLTAVYLKGSSRGKREIPVS